MDVEDAYRQLRQTRLRCLRLEADKDVEILRAGKYRKILVAGEDGATQAQAADNFHMLRRTLVCPALPLLWWPNSILMKDAPRPTSPQTEGQVGSTIAGCPSAHPPVAGRSRPANDRTAAAVIQAHSVCLLCHSFVNLIDAK